jgi:hypothetical protein
LERTARLDTPSVSRSALTHIDNRTPGRAVDLGA